MIRKSPSELYIKYLLVHPREYTNDEILEMLLVKQLDGLGEYYLDRLRLEMPPLPRPFLPHHKVHKLSQTYILKNGLYLLFWPDEQTTTAYKILEAPRVKEFIETSLISYVPPASIAEFMTKARGFKCRAADIHRYRDVFWNVELLDRTEFKMLFDLRAKRLEQHSNPEIAAQAKSYRWNLQTDAKKAAIDLPYSPVGAMVSQMRMGRMPSNKEFAQLVEATRCMAMTKAFEAVACGREKGDHVRFKMYASGAKDLTEILEQVARPEEDLKDQLAAISLKSDKFELPTMNKLGRTNLNINVLEAHLDENVRNAEDELEGASNDVREGSTG